MNKSICLFLLTCCLTGLHAQRPSPDTYETSKGPLTVQPVYHGAIVLTWDNKTIYVDPYGGAKAFEGLKAPDLVLITDIHQDHLDSATLVVLRAQKSTFVVPAAVAEKLPKQFKKNLAVLANGQQKNWNGIGIEALPMYNLPEEPGSRHPKGRGNGYLITLGGKRIYISGDTEDIPEMRSLKNVDVAFVCMNLPYTMNIEQAASAVSEFKPVVVYPYHFRGKDGFSDIEEFKSLVQKSGAATEVKLRDWYSAGSK